MSVTIPVVGRVVEGDQRHAVSQIDLVNAIIRHLAEEQGVSAFLQRDFQAVISAADLIVNELRKPEQVTSPGIGLEAWLRSDHTGLSSLWMARVLTDCPKPRELQLADFAWPHDPADFKRCLTLLAACPELRERLPIMAEGGPQWATLVEHWDELEALFREEQPSGCAPKLMARMQELFTAAEQQISE